MTKTHTTSSRAGISIERISKMVKDGVDHEVIALQISKNSRTIYTANDIKAYCKLYETAKTKAPITKKQTKALMKDQKQYGEKRANLKIA